MTAIAKCYYVYIDPNNKSYYYYDTDTNETTYVQPTDGFLLDPTTRAPYIFPAASAPIPTVQLQPATPAYSLAQSSSQPAPIGQAIAQPITPAVQFTPSDTETVTAAQRQATGMLSQSMPSLPDAMPRVPACAAAPMSEIAWSRNPPHESPSRACATDDFIMDVPNRVRNFRPHRSTVILSHPPSFFPNSNAPTLPVDIKSDIHKFQMADFAQEFFRQHRSGKFFSRKKVSAEAMVRFQNTPLTTPLLQALDKSAEKKAVECFKLILAYTGADPSSRQAGSAMSANRLVSFASVCPELRDEIFFQLVKQTRDNPRPDCLLKTWELLLIFATIFPATRNSEDWIKSHIVQSSESPDPRLAAIAQFTYIRFSTRCSVGRPLEGVLLPLLGRIPRDPFEGRPQFGTSLYEQLWYQKKVYPALPIPLIVHRLAEEIIERDGEQTEGIFRLSGNSMITKQMIDAYNSGGNFTEEAGLHECASCFKAWFAELPVPIVAGENVDALKTAADGGKWVEFAESLPAAPAAVLKYLIGFLQRLVKVSSVTKMGASNMAIVFAPNIVSLAEVIDTMAMARFGEMAQGFIAGLIQTWDTSELYPLKPELLEKAKR
jgi:hypothetical protein